MEDPRSQRSYPKTLYELPAPKRETQQPRTQAPFSPINPEQAKETIRRPHAEVRRAEANLEQQGKQQAQGRTILGTTRRC